MNLEGCLPAAGEVAAPWWHRAPNMKNFDHHLHEFYKVLYTLRLSRWCNLMTWKGKRTKSRGFRLLSDCNFDQARRAVWQVVNHRCFRQSEFYLIYHCLHSVAHWQINFGTSIAMMHPHGIIEANTPLTLLTKIKIWLFFCWLIIQSTDVTFSNWFNLRI